MTKKFLLFLVICFAFNGLHAQDESPLTKTWTLGFALIGAEAIGEFPISEKATFRLSAGALLGASAVEVGQNQFEFGTIGNITASATYRLYYKFKDINRKYKPLFYNSGNFFFGQVAGSFPAIISRSDIDLNPSATVGFGWGLQRMYQNKFVFSLSIGPGIDIPDPDITFTIIGELTFGIRLSPKENE